MKDVVLAEYVWIDGTDPTPLLRSKTKVLSKEMIEEENTLPVWGFDGSSTKQAEGTDSDCVLKPVFVTPDPFRGSSNLLVLCEVWNTDDSPHISNERAACREIAALHKDKDMWFGLEQEYTLINKEGNPLGWPSDGLEPNPQGNYYCSAGADRAFGRRIAEEHLAACLFAGLHVSGINAEVCPGQWEYQIGPTDPLTTSDEVWLSRYIMERITEMHKVTVSWAGKPIKGDWNGAGCHTNFSTQEMRENYEACVVAAERLGDNAEEHIKNYGHGIEERLTGAHETCSHAEFKYGVSDRTASVRIPWQVALNKRGYIEDRRPNANCDPYKVTRLIVDTVCHEPPENK
jgi:glutamine synthetase